MQYRFLGRTGVRVSRLAFGTMSFADEDNSRKLFASARDAGINFFDCADVYSQGRAEELLGRFAAGSRDELVLATKAYFPMGDGPNTRGSSRYHLVRAVEASLRRLGTDRIDMFFLHRFDEATALEETLRALEAMVRDGKILYPAVSNFAAWQTARTLGIAERHGWAPIVCTQPMYNLLKRQAEVEILPLAQAESLGVLPYSPLAGGLLTGKYGDGRNITSGRLAEHAMYATRYADALNHDIAQRFLALATSLGVHPASLAVAWVASHPAVTAPILGARTPEQLEPSLRALDISIDADLRARISALSPAPPPATDRNEETTEHNYGTR